MERKLHACCLKRLEFHPVFTAHPTEARRKTIEKRIRTISELLDERAQLGGIARLENERRMLEEIDALFRTSPIAHKKPTPIEEADTILNLFDTTLFEMIPSVYRRFDDWELGDAAGTVPPVCPPFFHPGSWIGSDRDGNPKLLHVFLAKLPRSTVCTCWMPLLGRLMISPALLR